MLKKDNEMKFLKSLTIASIGMVVFGIIISIPAVMFFYGFEPVLLAGTCYRTEIPNFTFNQYLDNSVQKNGPSAFTKIITAIAFPGAKLGRVINNVIW